MKFLQPVSTPKGNGFFIGAFNDGTHCQVAIRDHGVQKNSIFRMDQVTEATEQKKARQPKSEPDPVLQVVDETSA
jgi:hypothetical protein